MRSAAHAQARTCMQPHTVSAHAKHIHVQTHTKLTATLTRQ